MDNIEIGREVWPEWDGCNQDCEHCPYNWEDDVDPNELIRYEVYDKTVVAYFGDGEKTVSVCAPDDEFDLRDGLAMCYLKHFMGKNALGKIDAVIRRHNQVEKRLAKLKAEAEQYLQDEQKRLAKKHAKRVKQQAKFELEVEEAKKKLRKTINE